MTINVRDHGATGTGQDDTAAIQAATTLALATGEQLHFPPGVYLTGKITGGPAPVFTVTGESPKATRLLLRAPDTQIFDLVDIVDTAFDGLTFDAQSVTPQAPADGAQVDTGTGNGKQLVHIRTTAATRGRKDFRVAATNCDFIGRTKGQGHIRVQIDEDAALANPDRFSEFDRITLNNCRFEAWGNNAAAIEIRGPGKLIEVRNCTGRDDGPYGFLAAGLDSKTGYSSSSFFGATAEVTYNHFIQNVVLSNCHTFRTIGVVFLQMCTNVTVENHTDVESSINPHWDTPWVAATADQATNTVTVTPAPLGFAQHNHVVAQVRGANLPAPLVNNGYYVHRLDGALALGAGMPALDLTASGAFEIRYLGARQNQNFKGDDNGSNTQFPDAVHTYRNVVIRRTSPLQPNFRYEQGIGYPRSARVVLDACELDRPSNFNVAGPKTRVAVRDTRIAAITPIWPTQRWAIGGPLNLGDDLGGGGTITDTLFEGTGPVLTRPSGVLIYRGVVFDCDPPYFDAPLASARLILDGCTFMRPGQLVITAPLTAGHKLRVDITNCRRATGVGPVTLRRLGANQSDLTIYATGHDLTVTNPTDITN